MIFRSLKHAILVWFLVTTPAVAAELPTQTGWHEIPDTRLRSICAGENGFSQVLGASGCWAITGAWSGGAFDSSRNRMIIFGGGHNDYYGNELYAFNLSSQTIERLTDPGLPIASSCSEAIANGTQPNSRHTYDGIEYIEHADKIFVFGGSLACSAGNFGDDTWTFDLATNEWMRMNPAGPTPWGDAGIMTAYDPISELVYIHDRKHFYSYDVSADQYTRLSSSEATLGYHLAATIDVQARKFVIVGYDSVQGSGRVYTIDIIANGDFNTRRLTTSGGSGVIGDNYPGLAYDPTTQKIVAWSGNTSVYSLDIATGEWEQFQTSGAPSPARNGTHGRWRYSPASGVFVSVNKMDDNIRIWRSPDQPVSRPKAPGEMQAQ